MRLGMWLLLVLALAGCSRQGGFGVTKSGGELVVQSDCVGTGFSHVRIGPDTGELEANGVQPVLTDADYEAEWLGEDADAPEVVRLSSPDPAFSVSGQPPDSSGDAAILIEAGFASVGTVDTTQRVVPSEVTEGSTLVPNESEVGDYEFISNAEFDSRSEDCRGISTAFWVFALAPVAVLAALAVGVYWFAVRSRRPTPAGPVPPPPPGRGGSNPSR